MAGIEEKLKTLWDGDVPDENTEKSLRERVTKAAEAAAEEKNVSSGAVRTVHTVRTGYRPMKIWAAACLIFAFGIGGLAALRQYTALPSYRYTDAGGETYEFPPTSGPQALSLHFDFPVVTRPLTAEESGSLFRLTSVRDGSLLANDDLVWRGSPDGGSGSSADAPDFSGGIANDDLVWREQTAVRVQEDRTGPFGEESVPESVPDKSSDAEIIYVSAGDGGASPGDPISAAQGNVSEIYGTFRQDTGELIRTEGKVGEIKIVCAAPGIALTDVVVSADGAAAEIAGRDVTLGSFTTRPNSLGARTAILCAAFEIDAEDGAVWRAYAEAAGDVSEAEKTAAKLLEAVGSMVSGPSDFGAVRN